MKQSDCHQPISNDDVFCYLAEGDCSFNWCSLNHTAQTLFWRHKLANPACSISQRRWISAKWSLRFGAGSLWLWLRYQAVYVLCLCQGRAVRLGAGITALPCRTLTAYHGQHQHRGTAVKPWVWWGMKLKRTWTHKAFTLSSSGPTEIKPKLLMNRQSDLRKTGPMNTWKQQTAKNASTFANKH